jgi:hypothetical protein
MHQKPFEECYAYHSEEKQDIGRRARSLPSFLTKQHRKDEKPHGNRILREMV